MKVRNLEPHPTTPLAQAAIGELTEIAEADRAPRTHPASDRFVLRQQQQDRMTAFFLGGVVAFVVIAMLAELAERVAHWIVG